MFATIKSLIPEPRQADQPRHYVGRHRQPEPIAATATVAVIHGPAPAPETRLPETRLPEARLPEARLPETRTAGAAPVPRPAESDKHGD